MREASPARTVREAYHATAEHPLEGGDPRYVSLQDGRGQDPLDAFRRYIELAGDEFLKLAFVSPRGLGKSTELLRLREEVRNDFSVIYFEYNTRLDPYHVDYADLLLFLARAVEEHMRTVENRPLDAHLLEEVARWFAEVTNEDEASVKLAAEVEASAEAKAEVPFVAKLLAKLTSTLKTESEHRHKIREQLKAYPDRLIANVNYMLAEANRALAPRKLLMLVDNLDRCEPAQVDQLLIQHRDLIRRINVHLVVTPPLILVDLPITESLQSVMECVELNMVRLQLKDGAPCDAGHKALRKVMERRLAVSELFERDDSVDRLVEMSGGSLRDLFRLTHYALFSTKGDRVTVAAVDDAVRRLEREFEDEIPHEAYSDLAAVAKSRRFDNSESHRRFLFRRYILRYANGEEWVDVHPVVKRLRQFTEACASDPSST